MGFISAFAGAIAGAISAVSSFFGGLGAFGQILVGVGLQLVARKIQKKKR